MRKHAKQTMDIIVILSISNINLFKVVSGKLPRVEDFGLRASGTIRRCFFVACQSFGITAGNDLLKKSREPFTTLASDGVLVISVICR